MSGKGVLRRMSRPSDRTVEQPRPAPTPSEQARAGRRALWTQVGTEARKMVQAMDGPWQWLDRFLRCTGRQRLLAHLPTQDKPGGSPRSSRLPLTLTFLGLGGRACTARPTPHARSLLSIGEELPALGLAELPIFSSRDAGIPALHRRKQDLRTLKEEGISFARWQGKSTSHHHIPSRWVASQRFRGSSWRSSWAQRVNIVADRARLAKTVGDRKEGY